MKCITGVVLLLLCACVISSVNAQSAPDFTATLSNEESVQLFDTYLNNDKTVVLKFFFSSCPPCQAISPMAEALYQEFGAGQNDVEFISIGIYGLDNNASVNLFKQNFGISFPGVGTDGGSTDIAAPYLAGDFGTFFATPTFAVIAPDGQVEMVFSGNSTTAINNLRTAIQDTGAQIPASTASISGRILKENGEEVFNTNLNPLSGSLGSGDGNYLIENIELGSNLMVTPEKNINALNGVTTFDMVLISRHILGLDVFESPYLLIAADANNSGTVTTLDLVTIRRVILNIDQNFNGNTSWVFDPPFRSYSSIQTGSIDQDFVAIKVGDVNLDASPGSFSATTDRNFKQFLPLKTDHLPLGSKEKIQFKVQEDIQLSAFQLYLQFDASTFNYSHFQFSSELADQGHINDEGILDGNISIVWYSAIPITMKAGDEIFSISGDSKTSRYNPTNFTISSNYKHENSLIYNAAGEAFFPSIAINQLQNFTVFPTIVNSFEELNIIASSSANINYQIIDSAGKLIVQKISTAAINTPLKLSAVNDISSGLYFLKIMDLDHSQISTFKIIRK